MSSMTKPRLTMTYSFMNFWVCLLLFLPIAKSSIPPWSSKNDSNGDFMWRRLAHGPKRGFTIATNYTPSLLHPYACRYLSDVECRDADLSMQRHTRSHHRRMQHNINLGKVKVLVLLIYFQDHQTNRRLVEKSYVENKWQTEIAQWLLENSQGAYQIEPVVVDWVLTDNTEEYYSFGASGYVPELQQAMWPALDQLDNTTGWNWSQFDVDQDGELDSVVMMHSGYDAVINEPDCQGREVIHRIFPHAYSSSINSWKSKDGKVTLNGYTVSSTYDGTCDDIPFTSGIVTHEFMHTLGLIDLYDETDLLEAKGLGAWDIMSHPYGHDDSGTPGFLSAWSRSEAEWLTLQRISDDGTYTLAAAEISADAYRIDLSNYSVAAEYLVIENRQKISFDQNLWGTGLMIYHIDDAADGMKNKGYPGQSGWPQNGNHYRVAVLPKEGKYDLERNVNYGDAGDMWQPGDVLGPGSGGSIHPNTDSYQGGVIQETGITIKVVSQDGTDITFEVTGIPATLPDENSATTNGGSSSAVVNSFGLKSVLAALGMPLLLLACMRQIV